MALEDNTLSADEALQQGARMLQTYWASILGAA
jgi:hypothetical protein